MGATFRASIVLVRGWYKIPQLERSLSARSNNYINCLVHCYIIDMTTITYSDSEQHIACGAGYSPGVLWAEASTYNMHVQLYKVYH